MTQQESRIELGRATARAAYQLAAEVERIRFRPDPSPCPGDTYVFTATTGYPVQWAIIERDPEDARRLLVVAIDDYPQAGSRDLELEPGDQLQAVFARCDLVTRLDASCFRTELRTGALTPVSLERIRRKRTELAGPEPTTSLLAEEADGDPEYRRWREQTLEPALSALQGAAGQEQQPRRRRSAFRALLPMAASLLLVLAIGGSSGWQLQRMSRQLGEQQQQRATLIADKERLAQQVEQTGAELEQLQEQHASLSRGSAQALAELEQELQATRQREVETNLAFAMLRADDSRGPHRLIIEPSSRRVVLLVPVVDPEWYEGYRLDLVDRDRRQTVWSTSELVLTDAVLTFSLPAPLLSSGDYQIKLFGLTESGPQRLDEHYLLEVRRRR